MFRVERIAFVQKNRVVQLVRTNRVTQGDPARGRALRFAKWLVCLAFLVPLGACFGPGGERELRLAEEASAAGDWTLAAELWYDINRGESKKSERSYLETARALYGAGDVESSCALLRRARVEYPDRPRLLALHGQILERMRFSRAAEALYSQWVKLEPDSTEALLSLGRVRLVLGWEHSALEPLRVASKLDPMSMAAQLHLARLWSANGSPASAFPHYVRAIDLGASDPRFLTEGSQLALAPEVSQIDSSAVQHGLDWATRVTELQPQNTLAHYLRGAHLHTLGQDTEAIAALTRAVETDPASLPSLIRLISLYGEAGMPGKARAMLDQALIVEDDPAVRERLHELLVQGSPDNARISQK